MSTKTTFKRIALVAVAALGFGMLSVVPSSAAVTATYGTMYDSTNGTALVGGQASVVFDLETSSVNTFSWNTGSVLSVTLAQGTGAGRTGTPTFAAYTSGTGTSPRYNPTSGTLVVLGDTTAGGTVTLLLSNPTAGAQTVTCQEVTAAGTVSTPVSKSVTWVATSYTANPAFSTSYIGAASASTAVAANATVRAAKTVGTVGAQISTNVKSDVNSALLGQAISYQITSGPGTLSAVVVNDDSTDGSAGASGRLVSATATAMVATAASSVAVIADGTAGTTVITVTAGTVVIATHTMYFVGSAATYTPVVAYNTLALGSNSLGTSADYVIYVKAVDSNGNRVVDGSTVYAVSADPLTASIAASATTASGYAYFDVYGVKAGSTTITFRNASTAALTTVSAVSTAVTVTTSTLASSTSSVSMKFDKDTYAPGEKMTLSVTYKGAGGVVLADNGATGYVGVFSAAATSNVSLNGTLPGADAAPADGVDEYTLYAPLIGGTITVTTGKLIGVGSTNAQYLSRLTASATVTKDTAAADAAADAAAEATDAANAATDAANAAAEAADAATAAAQDAADAVAALSAQVASLISGLKAQLTSLTNLVIKIQKKVKA